MKFSSKVKKCGLSPMRKFHPYAVAAEAKGRKIYHLNIGQPDVETPPQFFEAVRNFSQSVLEYAPSPGAVSYTHLPWVFSLFYEKNLDFFLQINYNVVTTMNIRKQE